MRWGICLLALLVVGCGSSGSGSSNAGTAAVRAGTANAAAGCGPGARPAEAAAASGGAITVATIQSRLNRAEYAAKLLPKSYGVYVQVAPGGRQYRVDDVLNIDCPNGTSLYASLFVIHNAADRNAYLKNHVDPVDAPGSTLVRGDRVYQISASRGETGKIQILNTIVTVAETGQSPR